MTLPSLSGYLSRSELLKVWYASGVTTILASAAVALLTAVAENAAAISSNTILAALITFAASQAAAQLKLIQHGKPADRGAA